MRGYPHRERERERVAERKRVAETFIHTFDCCMSHVDKSSASA
jgi:hypothetical protein